MVRRCNPGDLVSSCPPQYTAAADNEKEVEEIDAEEVIQQDDVVELEGDHEEITTKEKIAEYCKSYTAVMVSSKK